MFKKRKPKRSREECRKESTQKEDDIDEDDGGLKQKTVAQVKKLLANDSENTLHSFGSSKNSAPATYTGGATSTLDIHTDTDRDARAIHERNLKLKEQRAKSRNENGTKLYQGQGAYFNPLEKTAEQLAKSKHTGTMGPLRAPSNLRATSRFDYQPDICKDYKETGFCGYGDNCKFMHDRSNYKAGWQIEKEWEEEQRKKKARLARGNRGDEGSNQDYPSQTESDKPFACFICRNPFTKPVVTKCKHYFCQKCALEHYSTSPKCAACGKPTGGIFNKAII